MDRNEAGEVDAGGSVGAGVTGSPGVKLAGAGVSVGAGAYPGIAVLAFVGGGAKPDSSDP